jgi:phytanoyl-CoA hydroxylase
MLAACRLRKSRATGGVRPLEVLAVGVGDGRTLDDTHCEAGTLEYVPGSHLWPLTPLPDAFHGQQDYRSQMKAAAEAAGLVPPEPIFIEVPAGSCVFHAGSIWHGSGPNTTGDRMRRSIGIHMLPADARFSDKSGGYIYRRYQSRAVQRSL